MINTNNNNNNNNNSRKMLQSLQTLVTTYLLQQRNIPSSFISGLQTELCNHMCRWMDGKHSLSNIHLCNLLKESAEMYCQCSCVMCVAASLMLLTVLCCPHCMSLQISLVQ